MTVPSDLKRLFAEEVRAAAALPDGPRTERIVNAFAAVAREAHVGAGPWMLYSPMPGTRAWRTPDCDPHHLYHDVLIALNEAQGINIGQPSLWAGLLARTPIPDGASILQVGAGSGYYTAILAELAGETGHVLAMETDAALADMARKALASRRNVTVRHGNGAVDVTPDDGPFDLIVAFAGVTHPTKPWMETLKQGGYMLLPVTNDDWWGATVLARLEGSILRATSLGPCGFYPCIGARSPENARRVNELWSESSRTRDTEIIIELDDGKVHYRVGDRI